MPGENDDALPPEGLQDDEIDMESAFDEMAEAKEGGGDLAPNQAEAETDADNTDQAGDEPADNQPSASEADGDTPDAGTAGQGEDIWANAPSEARAAYEAAQREIQALRHSDASNRGRLSAVQRKLNEITQGNRGADEAARPDVKAVLESDEFKRAVEDYPDAVGPIAKALSALLPQVEQVAQDRERQMRAEQERLEAEAEALVRQEHPDFDDIGAGGKLNQAFAEWVRAQPPSVQQAVMQQADKITDPEEAAVLIRRFKQDTGLGAASGGTGGTTGGGQPTDLRRQAQLRGSRSSKTGGVGVPSGPPEDFDKAFDHFAERRDRGAARR